MIKKNIDGDKYVTVNEMHEEKIITHFLSLCFTGFPLSKILHFSRQGLNSTLSPRVPEDFDN